MLVIGHRKVGSMSDAKIILYNVYILSEGFFNFMCLFLLLDNLAQTSIRCI